MTNLEVVDTADIARLVADPTRVRVLNALVRGPQRTSQLATLTSMSSAALTRHLQLLRSARVIERIDVEDDGRGRAYQLVPGALDDLADWIRSTTWTAELPAASSRSRTQDLLIRVGAFLDALGDGDRNFFERYLREDAVLVFPGLATPVDKEGCLQSVANHPPYRCHRILTEPILQRVGANCTVLTFRAEVATTADDAVRPNIVTAVFDEREPWQLVHLQWTPSPSIDMEEALP
ncbi:MAG: ArsR/SmtB family transcription factor [Acidimicrobiales bacterium]